MMCCHNILMITVMRIFIQSILNCMLFWY